MIPWPTFVERLNKFLTEKIDIPEDFRITKQKIFEDIEQLENKKFSKNQSVQEFREKYDLSKRKQMVRDSIELYPSCVPIVCEVKNKMYIIHESYDDTKISEFINLNIDKIGINDNIKISNELGDILHPETTMFDAYIRNRNRDGYLYLFVK